MPIYSYICDNCLEVKEVEHGMNESPSLLCAQCQTVKLRKVPSNIVIAKNKEEMMKKFLEEHKPGEIVEQSIKESKDIIEIEKESLKNRVWNPNFRKGR